MQGLGKWLALAGCMTVLSACATTEPKPAASSPTMSPADYMNQIMATMQTEDCPAFTKQATPIHDNEMFASLPVQVQGAVISRLGDCAYKAEDPAALIKYTKELEPLLPNDKARKLFQPSLLSAAVMAGDMKTAQTALDNIASADPEQLSKLAPELISIMWTKAYQEKDARAAHFKMAKTLTDAGYHDAKHHARPGAYVGPYAEGLLQHGKVDEAKKLLLAEPRFGLWKNVWTLKRYDVLRQDPDFNTEFDLMKAFHTSLAHAKKVRKEHPDELSPILSLMSYYSDLGEYEKARDLGETTRKRIDDSPIYLFTDEKDQFPWLLNELASTYKYLGDETKALAVLTKASQMKEKGQPNVSQLLNLAHMQVAFGRDQEALDTLKIFSYGRRASPYGQATRLNARVCALSGLGKDKQAETALKQLQEYRKDAPGLVRDGLICMNRLQAASKFYLDDLHNEDRQAGVVSEMQHWKTPPNRTAREKEMDARRAKIYAMPDIQKAANKVGRIMDMPLYSD